MWIAFRDASSALFRSTGSLPSWIQQSGSIAPWRPEHIQASNSFAGLPSCMCTVYILSLRNMTVEAKQMYNMQRFWNTTLLCSCMKKHIVVNRILSWCFIFNIGWNFQSSQRFSSSLSFLPVLTHCLSKTQYHAFFDPLGVPCSWVKSCLLIKKKKKNLSCLLFIFSLL